MNKYAHSKNDKGEWHLLEEHLNSVAEISSEFASKFNARDLGYFVGKYHDIGKKHNNFYKRLCGGEKYDHTAALLEKRGED